MSIDEQPAAAAMTSEGRQPAAAPVGDVFLVVLPALTVFCYMALRMAGLGDGDSGWHTALGRWIVERREVPHADPFSYTALGHAWTAHEWLAGVAMAMAHAARGWPAVVLLYGGAMAVLLVTMALYLRRWLPPVAAMVPIAGCMLGLLPFMLARPHVLAWALLAIWVVALLRARESGKAPGLAMALLMTLWANVHGSFVFGLALIGPFALEALIAAPRAGWAIVVRQWGLFGLASLAAALVTPYGLHGLLFPFQLTAMSVLGAIGEWKPSDFSSIGAFEVVLLGGLFLCLLRPLRVPVLRLAIVIGLLHMALAHNRHQAIFLIVSILVLAEPLSHSWGGNGGRARFDLREAIARHRRELMPVFAVFALLAGGVAVWRLAVPAGLPDSRNVPATAIASIPDALKRHRGFNYYAFGGPLIFNRIPVFIDGRADMYGERLMLEYYRLADGEEPGPWREAQRRWAIRWTILPPTSLRARWLDRQPDWHRYHADRWAVIHVDDALWQSLRRQAPASPR